MEELAVYVPNNESPFGESIKMVPGSAIVGRETQDEKFQVYYEGNIYGSSNLKRYFERVEIAAGRLTERYPTIAKAMVLDWQLTRIGSYDPESKQLTLSVTPDSVKWWVDLTNPEELGPGGKIILDEEHFRSNVIPLFDDLGSA